MVIRDGKLLYCHGFVEGNVDKKVSTLECNNRTVYDCFNDPFTGECGSPDLNLPTTTIDYIPHPNKRTRYTPYLIPDAISVASEKSVSTLTTPYDSPDLLPYNIHNTLYIMKICTFP